MTRLHTSIPLLMIVSLSACALPGGCGSGTEQTPPPETVEPVEVADPVETTDPVGADGYDGPGIYECEKDSDCTNTCGAGSVNITWFWAHKDTIPKCKGGCAGKGAGKPTCVDGGCVAHDSDGTVDVPCTRKLDKK